MWQEDMPGLWGLGRAGGQRGARYFAVGLSGLLALDIPSKGAVADVQT